MGLLEQCTYCRGRYWLVAATKLLTMSNTITKNAEDDGELFHHDVGVLAGNRSLTINTQAEN